MEYQKTQKTMIGLEAHSLFHLEVMYILRRSNTVNRVGTTIPRKEKRRKKERKENHLKIFDRFKADKHFHGSADWSLLRYYGTRL